MLNDPFWAPLIIFGAIVVVGALIGGGGAGLLEENKRSEGGKVLVGVGFGLAGVGFVGIVGKLIGELIEYLF